MKLLVAIATLLITFATTADAAHAEDWTTRDTVYSTVSGSAGGAGGALAGGLAGTLLDGGCTFSSTSDCIPAFTIAGIGAGLIIGSAGGVAWYGKRRGMRGSFRSALLGSLLGHLASGTVVVLAASTIDSGTIGIPVVLTAMIGMPALGATISYKYSAGRHEPPPVERPMTGALLDIGPEGVTVNPPVVGIAVTPEETALVMPLASGRF